jgi:hypothetical protein
MNILCAEDIPDLDCLFTAGRAIPVPDVIPIRSQLSDAFIAPASTHTAMLSTFTGGHYYHEDGIDRLILRDGTFFLMNSQDERNFLKEPIPCTNHSHMGLRNWYGQLVLHAVSHEYYVHPFGVFGTALKNWIW